MVEIGKERTELVHAAIIEIVDQAIKEAKFSEHGFLEMRRPVPLSTIFEGSLNDAFDKEIEEYGGDCLGVARNLFRFSLPSELLLAMDWEGVAPSNMEVRISTIKLRDWDIFVVDGPNETIGPQIVSIAASDARQAKPYFLQRLIKSNGNEFGLGDLVGVTPPESVHPGTVSSLSYLVDLFVGLFDRIEADQSSLIWEEVGDPCEVVPGLQVRLDEMADGITLPGSPISPKLQNGAEEFQKAFDADPPGGMPPFAKGRLLKRKMEERLNRDRVVWNTEDQAISFDSLSDLLSPVEKPLIVAEYLSRAIWGRVYRCPEA